MIVLSGNPVQKEYRRVIGTVYTSMHVCASPAEAMLVQSSGQAHMVMAREMPRLSQMKGVLAPFPLPGAPFSHTTSSGAWIGCSMHGSNAASGVLVWMPVLVRAQSGCTPNQLSIAIVSC